MSEVKIPEGYKQTEIGVIPEDWKVKDLGSFMVFKNGLNKAKEFFGYGTPIVNYMDVYKSGSIQPYNIAGKVFVTSDEIRNYSAIKGDVFFTRTSETVEEIGLSSVLIDDIEDAVFSGFVLRARLKKKTLENSYMKYCFRSKSTRNQIQGTASYTTRALTNGKLLSNVLIPIPPKKEQTAIATALSDVDNLIQSLEKLIAKKEAIKTGTMQQLLTGKTRLPEFATRDDGSPKGFKQTELGRIPEDWDYKTLSEMTENKGLVRGPFGGALKKDSFVRTGFKVYEQRNAIYANTEIGKYYIDKDKFNELQRFTVKPKDFIVSCSGTIGRIYQIPVNAPEGIINQALLKITLNKNTDEHFFYQIFNSKEFQESITDSTQGGAMKNLIGMSEFKKSIMLMPSKPEQTAIATILSDMDVEIQALQQRLEKTRDIKQGMMQQLLTGKVRLAH